MKRTDRNKRRQLLLWTLLVSITAIGLGLSLARQGAAPTLYTYDARLLQTHTGEGRLVLASGQVLTFQAGTHLITPRRGDYLADLQKTDQSLSLIHRLTGSRKPIATHVLEAKWSSDGQRLFYFKQTTTQQEYAYGSWFVYSLKSQKTYLVASYVRQDQFLVSGTGDHYAYLKSNEGLETLYWGNLHQDQVNQQRVAKGSLLVLVPDQGDQVIYVTQQLGGGLKLYQIEAGQEPRLLATDEQAQPGLTLQGFTNPTGDQLILQRGQWNGILSIGQPSPFQEIHRPNWLWQIDPAQVIEQTSQQGSQLYLQVWRLASTPLWPIAATTQPQTEGQGLADQPDSPVEQREAWVYTGPSQAAQGHPPEDGLIQLSKTVQQLVRIRQKAWLVWSEEGLEVMIGQPSQTPEAPFASIEKHPLALGAQLSDGKSGAAALKRIWGDPESRWVYLLTTKGTLYRLDTGEQTDAQGIIQGIKQGLKSPQRVAEGLTDPQLENSLIFSKKEPKTLYRLADQTAWLQVADRQPERLATGVVDLQAISLQPLQCLLAQNDRVSSRRLVDLNLWREGQTQRVIEGAFYPYAYYPYRWLP